jgi:carbamoyl-phosphate synthase large subunit
MPSPTINILMTGGGAPGAAGILECLRQDASLHVTIADANPHAVGRYLHGDFSVIPRADDLSFIDSMLAVCRQKNIHVVLPLVTRELLPLSRNMHAFELAGARVLVSTSESLEIANNKSRLYEFLQWRGIEVPAFRIVETVEQFKQAVEELGYPKQPVCFKPSVSNGSRGFRIINNAIDEAHLLFNEKPHSTYISYADAVRILSSRAFPQLLVSEYLPGDEYSVDCLARHGEAMLVVPRLRKKMINGISVEGGFVKEDSIIDYCTRIIKELQLHGNIGIQVKRATSRAFLIVEINPRVQGTIAAALGAGVNLPLLAIQQELDIPEGNKDVKWGTKFIRYWKEIHY